MSDIFAYAQARAINDGKRWSGYKIVEGKSIRRYKNKKKVAEICLTNGYSLSQLYKQELIGITEMEKLMGKKKFAEIIGKYIEKPKGKVSRWSR